MKWTVEYWNWKKEIIKSWFESFSSLLFEILKTKNWIGGLLKSQRWPNSNLISAFLIVRFLLFTPLPYWSVFHFLIWHTINFHSKRDDDGLKRQAESSIPISIPSKTYKKIKFPFTYKRKLHNFNIILW